MQKSESKGDTNLTNLKQFKKSYLSGSYKLNQINNDKIVSS